MTDNTANTDKSTTKQRMKISPYAVSAAKNKHKRTVTPETVKTYFQPRDTRGFAGREKVREAQNKALDDGGIYNLMDTHGFLRAMTSALPYGTLVNLTQNGLIRSGVEMRADEMTRKWIELTYGGRLISTVEGNGDDGQEKLIGEINSELKRFEIRELFRDASCSCGYYGGCLVYIDMGDLTANELRTPLSLDADLFKKGALRGFKIIEPFDVAPGYYNTSSPLSSSYFKPEFWYVLGQEVHASRFLYFAENKVPTWLLPSYNFFGISLSQIVLDVVTHFTECREAVARLLKKFSLTVMATDMNELMTGGEGADIERRIDYFVEECDNDGLMVIDNESERIEKIETPLNGVTDIVHQAMQMVAAYFGEPVVKLWGISPGGFNATGESDMVNHYEHIASVQGKILREPLEKIIKLLQLNSFGQIDDSLTFNFLPLGDGNDKAIAELNNIKAHSDVLYYKNGLVSAEEIRKRVSEDPQSYYCDIDPAKIPPQPEQTAQTGGNPLQGDYNDKNAMENKYNVGSFVH